ncbi:DNA-directed RNA polymerase [Alteromonas sp. BMJM2]|uniref:DNA-directed RNA polymerase n=1 Tax=Alteromonas sp. BMJM2 TaxID=2954241 RepID=UPI0022B429F0|nr:DNA-directed RNA polymerase [Alteromonas sp. BMJM2]
MELFTGKQYVKIALANAFGLDKELFQTRLDWVETKSMDELHALVHDADEPAIYLGALLALEDAEAGRPSGFMVGLDACSSGVQIMGAMMNCEVTCKSTGLIDTGRRADIYSDVTNVMNQSPNISVNIPRKEVKPALMTHFYGSTEQPKIIFGEDTPELEAFYASLNSVAHGATIAMEHLLGAWQPYADEHRWSLPDGFVAVCPVTEKVDKRIEVDELDHSTFTHRFEIVNGQEKGLSIAANVVHSIDGMLVREMNRRCNYDPNMLKATKYDIENYWAKNGKHPKPSNEFVSLRLAEKFMFMELLMSDFEEELEELHRLIVQSLAHKSFPVKCVHDEFKCHPNNMNHLRKHYVEMFQQLAKSDLLSDILTEIHGSPYSIAKVGNVVNDIGNANYALS